MADISNDIRLAVDSGVTAVGARSVLRSIKGDKAKLIIVASKSEPEGRSDIEHLAKVAGISVIEYGGTPVDLGTLCGKPFSVSMLSIIEAGNSKILDALDVKPGE